MSQHYEVIVVGAGAAGTQVTVGLVAAGFAGSIALLGSESGLPYERPPLNGSIRSVTVFRPRTVGSSRTENWFGRQAVERVLFLSSARIWPGCSPCARWTMLGSCEVSWDRTAGWW